MKRRLITFMLFLVCTMLVANAQDTKPIIKPKPTTTTKPAVVKAPPKPITKPTATTINFRDKYDYIGVFYEGLAVVRKYGKFGFVDNSGKEVIPLIYDDVIGFSEELWQLENMANRVY
ncbi:MAG: WG repeat-containing protein [Bacteroidetes bacterium]|nr:WG repeat-containing protein [Bacteroidota bacterium]